MQADITIIGSGIGGLLCGVILAKEGLSVRILEKAPEPGGLLRGFNYKGIHFDTGMHYTGAMQDGMVLNAMFRYTGILEDLDILKLDENGFDRIFLNGKEYRLASGFDNFIHQLHPYFPDDQKSINEYVSALKKIVSHFPLYNLQAPSGSGMENEYLGQSARSFLLKNVQNPVLREILAGNSFLYGGLSEATPLSHLALVNHSFISGAYRFIDGSHKVADLLIREFRNHGGEIICNTEVTGIGKRDGLFRIEAGKGELATFSSRNVISSMHPARTVKLTGSGMFREVFATRITQLRNTVSAFALYAVLKPGLFPYLNFNCYGCSDEGQTENRSWPDHYLLITPANSADPGYAHSLEIISMMRWEEIEYLSGQPDEAYAHFGRTRADALLDLVQRQFPHIRDVIEDLTIATPLTWQRNTGAPYGSIYGVQKDCRDPLRTSVPARTHVPGLYFTGQSVNLHGMTGTAVGALMTCGEILGHEYLITKLRNV